MRRWIFLVPLCLLLSACGGNDSSSFAAGSSSSSGSSTSSSSSGSSTSSSSSSASSSSSSSGGTSSGGSGPAFWLPYQSTPAGTGGQTGLFVIPSNALTAAPAYVTTSASTKFLAAAFNITLNSSRIVTAYSPGLYLYTATDSSNNIHIYKLDLALGTQPTPIQIGTLSLPLPAGAAIDTVICDSNFAYTNLATPTSLFVVLHVAGGAGCGTAGDTWLLVHASDGPTTAPTSVPISNAQFTPLYSPLGALTGLVLLDPNTHSLFLYPDNTFSAPVSAVAGGGITSSTTVYDNLPSPDEAFVGTNLFLALQINSVNYLYRLSYADTAAVLVYTATGTLSAGGVADDSNLYFSDVLTTTAVSQGIWQVALPTNGTGASAMPTLLYTYAVPATGNPYQLLGSDDTNLVLLTNNTNSSTNVITGALATIPVGLASTATVPLGPSLNGLATGFILPATPGTRASDLVFIGAVNVAPGAAYVYSSAVVTPENVVKQAQLPNSYFLTNGLGALSGKILQLTGINPGVPGLGGGQVNAVALSTLDVTPLKAPGGGVYTLPAGVDPFFEGLSNTIGSGDITAQAPTTGNGTGLAYDLSQSLIVPIGIANTDVSHF
jgi:hypothetical protein